MNKKYDIDYINNLILNKTTENIVLEYKKEICNNNKEIAKDISAMANSEGGTLIYGLDEDDKGNPKSICPLDPTNNTPEKLEQIVNSTIYPNLIINIFDIDYNNKKLYILEIPKSKKLHMVIKNGDNRYYKRSGRTIIKMEHSDIIDKLKSQINSEENILKIIENIEKDLLDNTGNDVSKNNFINLYIIPDYRNGINFHLIY